MRIFSLSRSAIAICALVITTHSVRAQWREVSRNLVLPEQQHIGAIRFHGGVAWAGTYSLYSSNDSGITWKQSVSFTANSGITDIAIYDSLHVLVGTIDDGLFLTVNAGQTWQNFQPGGNGFNQPTYDQVAFNGSSSVLHALESDASILYTSYDGGATWNGVYTTNTASIGALCFAIASDRTIYVFSINESSRFGGGIQGWIDASTDLGQTWNALNGDRTVLNDHGDSYNLTVDSCNDQRLYLINENVGAQSGGNEGRIDLTTNAGSMWQTVSSQPLDYYNGSLASTPNVLYAGTVNGSGAGVDRSTDSGLTWKNIGGPNEVYDTRSIAAINDNIVLVLDENGSVWRTLNSGGFPLQFPSGFSASPAALFAGDTVSCDSLTRSVVFTTRGCSPLSVTAANITGTDAANYRVVSLTKDSVLVTMQGLTLGSQQAELVLQLSNGSSDTVALTGFVNTTSRTLTLLTQDVHTDTLGGTVAVPITLDGLISPESVNFVMNYDATLDYLGSFSPSGVKLDIPGEQWPGRSMLQVLKAAPDSLLGYAMFNVFNDSAAAAHATFDSLVVLNAPVCEYSAPTPVTSTITTLSGCGITILSDLLHLGQAPLFRIWPNPASGNVWVSSSTDISNGTLEIYDMLGAKRSEVVAGLQKDIPMELTLPDADGVYQVILRTAQGMGSLRVIRHN